MNPYKKIQWVGDLIKDLKDQEFNVVKLKQDKLQKQKQDLQFELGETPQKKNKKNEEIKGEFEIQGFEWFEKSKNGKKFLKITEIPEGINEDTLKNSNSNYMVRQQIQYIISFISQQDQQYPVFMQKQNQEYLKYISNKLNEYIKNKDLITIKSNQLLSLNKKQIELQLICENEQEALIIEFKHATAMAEQLIKLDEQQYYYNKTQVLLAHNQKENKKNKINLMIIPLNNLKNLRFIEFSGDEILEIYKDKLQSKEYQDQKVKKLEQDFEQQPQLLEIQIKIFDKNCKQSLYEYVKQIIESKNEEKISFFKDISNSVKLKYDYNARDDKELHSKDLFDQFYMIYTLIIQETYQRNKIFQKYVEWNEQNKRRIQQQAQNQNQFRINSFMNMNQNQIQNYNQNQQRNNKPKPNYQKRNYNQSFSNKYHKKQFYGGFDYDDLKYHMSYTDWYEYGLSDYDD